MKVLIGYTGFLGQQLQAASPFDLLINSKNLADLAGQEIDLAVVAAPSAVKWQANQVPATDKASILALLAAVNSAANIKTLVHLSTTDVYSTETVADKPTELTKPDAKTPYGAHRAWLETAWRWPTKRIRLPALFGPGLKKNYLFDLLSDQPAKVNSNTHFQWWSTDGLWSEIQAAITSHRHIFNIATEPVSTEEIVELYFPQFRRQVVSGPEIKYNMYSTDGYRWDRTKVLNEIYQFLASHQ